MGRLPDPVSSGAAENRPYLRFTCHTRRPPGSDHEAACRSYGFSGSGTCPSGLRHHPARRDDAGDAEDGRARRRVLRAAGPTTSAGSSSRSGHPARRWSPASAIASAFHPEYLARRAITSSRCSSSASATVRRTAADDPAHVSGVVRSGELDAYVDDAGGVEPDRRNETGPTALYLGTPMRRRSSRRRRGASGRHRPPTGDIRSSQTPPAIPSGCLVVDRHHDRALGLGSRGHLRLFQQILTDLAAEIEEVSVTTSARHAAPCATSWTTGRRKPVPRAPR
jgi:hypothetical protein